MFLSLVLRRCYFARNRFSLYRCSLDVFLFNWCCIFALVILASCLAFKVAVRLAYLALSFSRAFWRSSVPIPSCSRLFLTICFYSGLPDYLAVVSVAPLVVVSVAPCAQIFWAMVLSLSYGSRSW